VGGKNFSSAARGHIEVPVYRTWLSAIRAGAIYASASLPGEGPRCVRGTD